MALGFRLAFLLFLTVGAVGQTLPFSANATSRVTEVGSDALTAFWGSDGVSLLLMYSPQDKGVAATATMWEALATEYQDQFTFFGADAVGPLKYLVTTFKVLKTPAVLAFPSRLVSKQVMPTTYSGKLDANSVAKWAVKQLPYTLITKITTEPELKRFKSGTTPKVCVYHNDSEVAPAIRSLSLAFADRLSFGEVKVKSNKTLKVAEKEGISTFPSVMGYQKTEKAASYAGSLANATELAAFLEPLALTIEEREVIRKERQERREKEERERKEREAKERQDREARKRAEAAEKKLRNRERRKVVKALDAVYRVQEEAWASQDGELIQVRTPGWDQFSDAAF